MGSQHGLKSLGTGLLGLTSLGNERLLLLDALHHERSNAGHVAANLVGQLHKLRQMLINEGLVLLDSHRSTIATSSSGSSRGTSTSNLVLNRGQPLLNGFEFGKNLFETHNSTSKSPH